MTQIATVIVGFILTGIVGNRLAQAWQQRHWLSQQRFLGHEKEYTSLRDLCDEISKSISRRLWAMRRVQLSFSSGTIDVRERLKAYDEALSGWNESLSSFYVRLTLYSSYEYAVRLEDIQKQMALYGSRIEKIAVQKISGTPPPQTQIRESRIDLDSIQGIIFEFNRDLLNIVGVRREDLYYGSKIEYRSYNLPYFSTLDLFKALFVRDVDAHSIVRPALDPRQP